MRFQLHAICTFITLFALAIPVAGQEWSFAPPLNVDRNWAGACTTADGSIIVVGGSTGNCCPWGETNTVEMLIYDRDTGYSDTWIMLESLSAPRIHPAVVRAGHYVYVAGGSDGNGGSPTNVERLDLLDVGAGWDSDAVTDLPMPLSSAQGVVDGYGRIWVIGPSFEDVGTTLIFDPARPELGWVSGPDLTEPRSPCCRVGITTDRWGRIYALGGGAPPLGAHLSVVERLDPLDTAPSWNVVADIPTPSGNTNMATLGADGRIYIAGGWMPGLSTRALRYDPKEDTWKALPPLATPKNGVAMVRGADGRVFAIGGESGGVINEVEVLEGQCGAGGLVQLLLDSAADGDIGFDDVIALLNHWGDCP